MTPYYEDEWVTLYHGDMREVLPLLGENRVDCVVTDPPYGQTSLEWDRCVPYWPRVVAPVLAPHGSMWCFGSLRMFMDRVPDFKGWKLAQDLVWEKHNGSNFHADRFRRVHEQVAHFYPAKTPWEQVYNEVPTTPDATKRTVRRKERPPHTGEIAGSTYTSQDGGPRLQRSVIQARSMHGSALHPTEKPVGVLSLLIEASCPPGGVVLDPFAGSGSTGEAARQLGRESFLVEADERYCEIAAKRLSQGVLNLA